MDFLRSSVSPKFKIERNVSIICTHADVGHLIFKLVSSCWRGLQDIDLEESAKAYPAVTSLATTRAAKELAGEPYQTKNNSERADAKY